tara:strand:+ start:459 stop:713 length:255 start_codon:yes stop_codon:yes gene_type:complete
MATRAHIEQSVTHKPDKVNVIKNCEADVLIVLNLLSSPALCILMNKNNPNRIVHIDINKTKIRFPKLREIDLYVDKKTNHTTLK